MKNFRTFLFSLSVFISFAAGIAAENIIITPNWYFPRINAVRDGGNGNTLIIGTDYVAFNSNSTDVFLYRVDANGNTVWSAINDSSFYIDGLIDGTGFMLLALDYYSAFTVDRADSSGNTVYSRAVGDSETVPRCMADAHGGGYIVAGDGFAYSSVSINQPYIEKIDAIGDCVWAKSYLPYMDSYVYKIIPTLDGGYLAGGETYDGYDDYMYLLKVDANGDCTWTKTYGIINWISDMVQEPGGNYLMLAGTYNYPDYATLNYDFMIIETDPSGNILNNKTYDLGNTEYARSLSYSGSPDFGYMITGESDAPSSGGERFSLFSMQVDTSGNTKTPVFYGSAPHNMAWGPSRPLGNGDYMIAGSYNDYDIYVNRISAKRVIPIAPSLLPGAPETYACPQPAADKIKFVYSLDKAAEVIIYIYNYMNRLVGKNVSSELPGGNVATQVDITKLPAGIYFYQVTAKYSSGGDKRYAPDKFMVKK